MGEKMWPLPIGDLFSVGRVSREKLSSAGIRTIGDAARMDVAFLTALLGDAHGKQVYDYAHGVDDTPVTPNQLTERKGIGNSMTIAYDVKTPEQADKILLALSEKIGARLRASGHFANVVSVSIRPSDLLKRTYGHQRKLRSSIRSTDTIYEIARTLFREAWRGEPVRQLGVHLPEIAAERSGQIAFDGVEGAFMTGENEIGNPAFDTIDCTVDSIREKFGSGAIKRGIFADGKEKSVRGRTSPDSENGL
jgi:DNA polymerase-4